MKLLFFTIILSLILINFWVYSGLKFKLIISILGVCYKCKPAQLVYILNIKMHIL